jgi:hypothetical protein
MTNLENAFQKPYSPPPSAGLLRMTILETCSFGRKFTSMNRIELPWRRNSGGGKNLDALVSHGY